MNVIAEFTLIPIGVGVSLSKYVAACERILQESGLRYELHANGTNVEGEWDEVMAAIKRCHETLHAMGVPRISTLVKIGTRTDRVQHMEEKVRSVQARLSNEEKEP
ncbi:MAG: thiamine-binding protein [Anaerolineae bacterium]|nr:MAG: thiamine-binding protein [Anaerolineae bacterium]